MDPNARRIARAGLVSLAALGAASCANVLGLDAYRDGVADGGAGVVDSGVGAIDARLDAPVVAEQTQACVADAGPFQFAEGTEYWHALHGGGTIVKATDLATNCADALKVTTTTDDWYGFEGTSPLPVALAGLHAILVGVTTTNVGTSPLIGVNVGGDYHWCQLPGSFVAAGASTTLSVDLTSMLQASACGGTLPADISTLRGFWVFLGGGGVYYIDDVWTR